MSPPSAILDKAVKSSGALGAVAAVRSAAGNWSIISSGKDTLSPDAGAPDPRSAYPLFSLTKTVVAAAVLRLRDEEMLTLNRSAGEFAGARGGFPGWLASVKLIDLLRLTGRLPEYTSLKSYNEAVIEDPNRPWTTDGIFAALDSALQSGDAVQPDGSWSYSNTGYWALGRIIENVTGAPLADTLRSLVFDPLRLSNLSYGVPRRAAPSGSPAAGQEADQGAASAPLESTGEMSEADNRLGQATTQKRLGLGATHSRYLSGNDQEIECSRLYDPRWAGPAGGLVGTVADYGHFLQALLVDRSFLSPSSLDRMLTKLPIGEPFSPDEFKLGYGLGLFFDDGSDLGTLVGHGGSGPGCHTIAKVALSSGAIVVLASNSERADPDRLAMPLLKQASSA